MDSPAALEFPRLTALAGPPPDGNSLKYLIENLLRGALAALPEELRAVDITPGAPTIERTRDATHGDFALDAYWTIEPAAALPSVDGRGGGKADAAQGGGTRPDGVDPALKAAREFLAARV